jgi:hypothetical protein
VLYQFALLGAGAPSNAYPTNRRAAPLSCTPCATAVLRPIGFRFHRSKADRLTIFRSGLDFYPVSSNSPDQINDA